MSNEQNPPLSPDEKFERDKKIEGIFVPRARKQRDEVYELGGKRPFARFVHYTSADAALKIITQKQLWMRNAACMADFREVEHGFSILLNFFSKEEKRKTFYEAVSSVALGVGEQAVKKFDDWWKTGTIRFKTFILSTSEHSSDEDVHGRLSMWRAFGTATGRVGLVFKVPARSNGGEAMRLTFSPIAYFKNDQADQLMSEVVKNIIANVTFLKTLTPEEIGNWIFYMLLWAATCTKHEGFCEEKEWRAVHCPDLYPTPLIKPAIETVGGVPQIVYKIPLDKTVDPVLEDLDFARLFDRLIIGPTPYPMAMLDAYGEALSKAGVLDARKRICISGIPIRS